MPTPEKLTAGQPKRTGCDDLDPMWPNAMGEPRGPTLCVCYPDCECAEKDAAFAALRENSNAAE